MRWDEAIEQGARALWPHEWECLSDETKATAREDVARVLDAAGWAEPTAYVVVDPQRGLISGTWSEPGPAFAYAAPGDRVRGLIPVPPPTTATNPIGEAMNATATTCNCTNPDQLCDDCTYYAAQDAEK